ncbi:DUF7507 domain-containing protein [Actinocorallia longicatena]|uniref:DUF7507 domain-containing protein n=1 Tax=Actinocorallia longicatena TaxID=111803 RepID=A0ABP6QAG8_9ACTN
MVRGLWAAGAVCAVGALVTGGSGAPAASAVAGSLLVSEQFTGAQSDPRFQGYGTACLTGAPQVIAVGAGSHPLRGCPDGQVGPVPPNPGAPFGYLQLTDAGKDRAGAALFQSEIPASDGLDVSFEQWQYGSTTPSPIRPGMQHADGISFFLTDGIGDLDAPGAFGGSLGYAQKRPDGDPNRPFIPGVRNGYLGIGLDALGNYFGDWEQRGDGCPRRSPAGQNFRIPGPGENMVTVRGPGDGTTGYCWLTATTSNTTTTAPWPSTLPGQLVGPLATIPPGTTAQDAQTLLEPSKRTVRIRISPAPDPQVTVDVDFQDGQGFHRVLTFDAPESGQSLRRVPASAAAATVPAGYSFGFAASTGAFTDVHLIRNVVVRSFRPRAALSLRKLVDTALPAPHTAGQRLPYRFVLTNTGDQDLDTLHITDPGATALTCPAITLAPGRSTTCTGHHTLTAGDIQRRKIVNTATATAHRTDNAGLVTSDPSTTTFTLTPGPRPRPGPPTHRPEPKPRPKLHPKPKPGPHGSCRQPIGHRTSC